MEFSAGPCFPLAQAYHCSSDSACTVVVCELGCEQEFLFTPPHPEIFSFYVVDE